MKDACRARGIRVMGDIPIFVAHDSADVWAHPELFQLHADGRPEFVAGVPPDYFSATGQLWGNPLYRWDRMEASGFAWWIERFRATLATVDLVRVDHFRGFEAFWKVPGDAKTAEHGEWVKGPGAALFEALRDALGELPIVAENLGVITPEVEALRAAVRVPGHGHPAVRVRQRSRRARPSSPTTSSASSSPTPAPTTTTPRWGGGRAGSGDSTRSEADVEKERAYALEYLKSDGTRDPLGLHPRRSSRRWPTSRSSPCRTCSASAARRA